MLPRTLLLLNLTAAALGLIGPIRPSIQQSPSQNTTTGLSIKNTTTRVLLEEWPAVPFRWSIGSDIDIKIQWTEPLDRGLDFTNRVLEGISDIQSKALQITRSVSNWYDESGLVVFGLDGRYRLLFSGAQFGILLDVLWRMTVMYGTGSAAGTLMRGDVAIADCSLTVFPNL